MKLEDELNDALIEGYQRAGEEVGYWGTRYRQAIRRNGGLATARRMLRPRSPLQRKGLDVLLEARRPDLTLEAIILQPKFNTLFDKDELAVARERLGDYDKAIANQSRENRFPDELERGVKYVEGARKHVWVNAYERNPRARDACLKTHGFDCSACGFNFESRYGVLGEDFIHVHHLKPLALTDGEYELDPINDLRPVCPNCHAMLHRQKPTLSIEELQAVLRLKES